MRNPKADDLGDVIADNSTMEHQFLYDEKEIYLQIIDKERTFDHFSKLVHNTVHILVREWRPDTWALGPLYEVRVDKDIIASKFSIFLTDKVFPHIEPDNLFCCKVSLTLIRHFKRGDLILRRWSRLKSQS